MTPLSTMALFALASAMREGGPPPDGIFIHDLMNTEQGTLLTNAIISYLISIYILTIFMDMITNFSRYAPSI